MALILSYIIKTILCSGILFGYYWFFLRNKGFHSYNRFYLLCLVAISLLLPLIKINFWQQPTIESSNMIHLLQAIPGTGENIDGSYLTTNSNGWHTGQCLLAGYISVSMILLFAFARSIYSLWCLIKSNGPKSKDGISLIHAAVAGTPFSFLQYIFWNNNVDIDSPTGRLMLKHELVHVQHKHSYDKLFISLTTATFWCNPFFWLVKKELAMVHEFVADKLSIDDNDTSAFANMILQAAYPRQNFQLTNNFFHSPIKRRFTMLTKNNNRVGYISRMAALPLFFLVFAGFTFKAVTKTPLYTGEKTIVVIDAGHGGEDFGAKAGNGTAEKEITLALAKRIKEKNTNSRIGIILSRSDDASLAPQERVDFAKTKNAGLFISLHVDAAENNQTENKTGIHLYTPLISNAAYKQSQLLGSAIVQELKQGISIPVPDKIEQLAASPWILKANTCPAVLIEAGYITNPADLSYILSTNGQETIAQNILNGIEKYLAASATEKQP